ncbi:MAG: nitrous oxide reductase accessory protein NosL [Gammaproteobacteria bacterium]|nr:nitrous oxide reductase accessory protein NosL [Gammaproteobacteria bacterium]
MKKVTSLLYIVVLFCLISCNKQANTIDIKPIALSGGEICHVCGMDVTGFPGPKAQAFIHHQEQPLRFCSTVDAFSWLLQPDTPAILRVAYVHNMGAHSEWKNPDEKHYINAKKAFYVTSTQLTGAMGPTLASFKEESSAKDFMKKYGGKLFTYSEINFEVLSKLQLKNSLHNN